MQQHNYIGILEEVYHKRDEVVFSISQNLFLKKCVEIIAENSSKNKGVYTVLVTLLVYKICHPKQDIRYHQAAMPNGFSGRSIDTQYITPTLKKLDLPSMAETGWLTRSLEQPYPYNLSYQGKITPKNVKDAFLEIIDQVQSGNYKSEEVLRYLLCFVEKSSRKNKISISKIEKSDNITFSRGQK